VNGFVDALRTELRHGHAPVSLTAAPLHRCTQGTVGTALHEDVSRRYTL